MLQRGVCYKAGGGGVTEGVLQRECYRGGCYRGSVTEGGVTEWVLQRRVLQSGCYGEGVTEGVLQRYSVILRDNSAENQGRTEL